MQVDWIEYRVCLLVLYGACFIVIEAKLSNSEDWFITRRRNDRLESHDGTTYVIKIFH